MELWTYSLTEWTSTSYNQQPSPIKLYLIRTARILSSRCKCNALWELIRSGNCSSDVYNFHLGSTTDDHDVKHCGLCDVEAHTCHTKQMLTALCGALMIDIDVYITRTALPIIASRCWLHCAMHLWWIDVYITDIFKVDNCSLYTSYQAAYYHTKQMLTALCGALW